MKNQLQKNSGQPWLFRTGRLAIAGLVTALALMFSGISSLAASFTWTGASTNSSNWSDTNNWSGLVAPSGTNITTITFSGTAQQTNVNDIAGLGMTNVTFTTGGWNISGSPVTVWGIFSFTGAGTTNVWGLDTFMTTGGVQANNSGALLLAGAISGTARIQTGNLPGVIILANTNNSFTGLVQAESFGIIFNSIAPAGAHSSLGAAASNPHYVLGTSGATPPITGTLTFIGTNNCATDRGLYLYTSGTLLNNSPNNSSLTFNSDTVSGGIAAQFAGPATTAFTFTLGGTSTGTNTFYGPFSSGGSSFLNYSLAVNGPGTYVFTNFIWATNSLTVNNNAHVVLGTAYFNGSLIPNNTFFTTMNFGSGSTLDVSAYDQIGSVFDIGGLAGSAGPGGQTIPSQTALTIGHTNGTVTDINGSLALAPSSFAPPAGAAILDVAGPRVAGILSINGNFTPGTATIQMDMGPNSAASDTIQVTGNLDLSQGPATINLNIAPQVTVQTGVPYTLIGYTGALTGDASGLNAVVSSPSYTAAISSASPNTITVTFTSTGVVDTRLPYLLWQGGVNGNWDTATANWFNGVSAGNYQNGLSVLFNDSSSQTAVGVIGSVAPASITVSNNTDSYVFSGGNITAGSLLKQGSGSLTLSGGNSYSGGTAVSAGTLVAGNATAFGTNSVTLGDTNSGANPVNLFLNASIANNINVTSNSTGTVTLAYPGTGSVTYSGLLTFQHDLIISNNSTVGNSLTFSANIAGTGNWTVYGGGGIKLQNSSSVFTGNITVLPTPGSSISLLNDNAILNSNVNVNLAGASTQFGLVNNFNHAWNVLTGNGTVLNGPGQANNTLLSLGSANGSGSFSGIFSTNAPVSPATAGSYFSITKVGTGTQTFTGDSTSFPGATIVNGGVLAINNTTGTGLGFGGVTVNAGGTLAGNGSITEKGVVNIAGGTLSVGNLGDVASSLFTILGTNTLNFTSNGVLSVDLFSGAGAGDNTGNPAAADILNAQPAVLLTNTATLTVNNPNNLTAWAIGDKWKIATWGSTVTGTFTTLNLPTLPAGMAWDTSALYSSGIIAISTPPVNPTAPATITGVSLSGDNLVLTGTNLNGGSNFHYIVLTTTNLTTPLANWTILSTNSFNADGSFSYTNAVTPGQPAAFFSTKAVQ